VEADEVEGTQCIDGPTTILTARHTVALADGTLARSGRDGGQAKAGGKRRKGRLERGASAEHRAAGRARAAERKGPV
jgi:hypothetical protein